MCIICLDLEKLTTIEAVNNLFEMTEEIGQDHTKEVMQLIIEKDKKLLKDPNHNPFDSLRAIKSALRLAPILEYPSENIEKMKTILEEFLEEDCISKD